MQLENIGFDCEVINILCGIVLDLSTTKTEFNTYRIESSSSSSVIWDLKYVDKMDGEKISCI